MSEAAKVYSLAAVVAAFGGIPLSGAGEGGWIEAEKKGDDYEVTVMVDGSVVRSFTNDRLWMLKLLCAQTATANDVLSAVRLADLISSRSGQGGSGVVPFTLADLNGTTLLSSPRAFITKPPAIKRTSKPQDHEWTIALCDCTEFIGGQL